MQVSMHFLQHKTPRVARLLPCYQLPSERVMQGMSLNSKASMTATKGQHPIGQVNTKPAQIQE